MISLDVHSLAVFLISISIYCSTQHQTIHGGDSGELIVAACTLGIPHPPGYPLHTILGYLFISLFPCGSPAAKVVFLSAFCSAISAAFIFCTVRKVADVVMKEIYNGPRFQATKDGIKLAEETSETLRAIALSSAYLSSGIYAFCPLIWSLSVQAEVFALNNLFVACLIKLTSDHLLGSDKVSIIPYIGSFMFGLGMSNQHTLLFVALPLSFGVLYHSRKLLKQGDFLPALLFYFLLGLSVYLYLILAAQNPSRGAWGDTSTWRGMVKHILREEYGTWKLFAGSDGERQGWESLKKGVGLFLVDLPLQTCHFGPLLALVGCWKMLTTKNTRVLGFSLLASTFSFLIFFHSLANLPLSHNKLSELYRNVHSRFWMQLYCFIDVFIGVGFSLLAASAASLMKGIPSRELLIVIVGVLGMSVQIAMNWRVCDKSSEWTMWEVGHDWLSAVPEGGVLIVKGDLQTNIIRYLMECEHARPDVQHLDLSHISYEWFNKRHARLHHLDLTFPGRRFSRLSPSPQGAYNLSQLIRANSLTHVLLLGSGLESLDPSLFQQHTMIPSGMLTRVYPPSSPPPPTLLSLRDCALRLPRLPEHGREQNEGSWERMATLQVISSFFQLSSFLLLPPPLSSPPSSSSGEGPRCRLAFPCLQSDCDEELQDENLSPPACRSLPGAAKGDECNPIFLQGCRGIVEEEGSRRDWTTCAAQIMVCSAGRIPHNSNAVLKNLAVAFERMSEMAGGDEWSKKQKILAYKAYVSSVLCAQEREEEGNSGRDDPDISMVVRYLESEAQRVSCPDKNG